MSNTHPSATLQARIYTLLTSDTTLMALLVTNGVYDNVPDNTEYPYVVLGNCSYSDWSSHTHQGFDIMMTINTYTQSRGKLQAQNIMNRIYTLLHNISLGLANYPTIVCREVDHIVSNDNDNRTYNGTQRFHIILGGNN